MAIHVKVAEKLQAYLVNRDLEALGDLINLLQDEARDPSMQEAIIKVDMARADLEQAISEEDYLKLPVELADSDVPVHEDKLVRIICKDQPEDSCMILKVGHLDDKFIKLFPIGGFEG